ncbi:MAG: hypothetical protein II039_15085 [Treponema sp.]|nr:hypothetical protein [Treponema sp.]
MVDEEREKVKIFLEAPPSQYEDLVSYAEYKRERFRDLADCVNREAVRGFIGAGNKAEPVVNAMCRVFEYIGVARSQIKDYVLACVAACRSQAKRFFKHGSHHPPERVASWWPEPQETDFSQDTEEPCHLDFVQRMSGGYTRAKGNLFARFRQEAKGKGVAYLADKRKWFQ